MPENKSEEIKEELDQEETEETEQTESKETEGNEELLAAQKAETEAKERLIRLQADFENYKKRTQKEKAETYAFAMESLMTKLLPVIDNMERAEAAADDDENNGYHEGVQMVFKSLMNILESEGLKEIEALGKTFDPNFHHGVAVGAEDDKEDQEILEVFQKGYLFKEKVIRAAMVKVNQK